MTSYIIQKWTPTEYGRRQFLDVYYHVVAKNNPFTPDPMEYGDGPEGTRTFALPAGWSTEGHQYGDIYEIESFVDQNGARHSRKAIYKLSSEFVDKLIDRSELDRFEQTEKSA